MFSITIIILIITCLVSFGAFNNQKIMNDLIFYPPAVQQGQWYRFFTCGLIHADIGHLAFNMISLYFFGEGVERAFTAIMGDLGRWVFLILYLSALVASLLPTYLKNKDNHYYRSLGASGAVSAVIFSGLLLAPGSSVYLFLIPIPIPGFIFAPLYLLISIYLDRRGDSNINHSAHIWGAVYGLAFTLVASYAVGFDVFGYFILGVQDYLQNLGQ
ncbi:rhomboid family intramembrane serine protease [Pseudocnuella soli]|uniref:rhomboid family intramembrane serine protease n=1 Tax=Pseudocnuella soli TaxID=2502779 RepID=UPI00104A92DB|nr:rhomboid family intramembrane serine protease [Pseudocnuella soli]